MKESPVKPGDVLADKYVVERVLGVGGMGVVVEAIHLDLHEARAIKVMLPEVLEEKDAVERFVREARAASRLKSEYVARVHDVGKLESGLPYIVMEHLEGRDLRMLLKAQGRLPVGEAVHYTLQACEALAEAHAAGIIHRDLKPGNLFLTTRADGSPCIKVLDFGISKQLGIDDEEMTKTHAVLGSPSYMSPEQMRSPRGVDARTDIWSMGVILYRLVTGELPFKGENVTSLVTLVLQSKPRPPSSIVPELSPELDAVILRCLERELPDRWSSVGELSAALLPFAPSEARASVERIARTLSAARISSPNRSSPSLPSARTSSPGTTSPGRTSPGATSRLSSPGSTSSPANTPSPATTSPGSVSARTPSPTAAPEVSTPPSEPPTVAVGKRDGASAAESTARSGLEAAPAGASAGPAALRGSNDGWANTSFGSKTVALRRSTLVAAAVGVLVVGGLVSLAIVRRSGTTATAAIPEATPTVHTEPVKPPSTPTPAVTPVTMGGDPPYPPAQPAAAAQAPRDDGAAGGPKPQVPADPPSTASETAQAPIATAPAAKGPLRPVTSKPAKSADAPKPEAPAPAPAPPTTAPHRMFGTEN